MKLMRRFLMTLPIAVLFFVAALPAHAALNLPILNPAYTLVPTACLSCPCSLGGVLQLTQNLINAAVAVGVLAAVLVIAYAGVSFMLNPTKPEARTQARNMILNVFIGLVIVLAAWLVVDFIMKTIYNQGSAYGPWNSVLVDTTANPCIQEKDPSAIANPVGALLGSLSTGTNPTQTNPPGGSYGTTGAQCSMSNQACSVSTLQGDGLSSGQANIMSCIAVTESSGNPGTPPYNQTHPGSNSSACGTFQITKTTWNTAASGACSNFASCTNAACNAQVATTLVQKSGYSSWTCPGCNNKAQGCVTKYGGG